MVVVMKTRIMILIFMTFYDDEEDGDADAAAASDHPRLSIVPFWSPPAHHKIPKLQLSITCGNW